MPGPLASLWKCSRQSHGVVLQALAAMARRRQQMGAATCAGAIGPASSRWRVPRGFHRGQRHHLRRDNAKPKRRPQDPTDSARFRCTSPIEGAWRAVARDRPPQCACPSCTVAVDRHPCGITLLQVASTGHSCTWPPGGFLQQGCASHPSMGPSAGPWLTLARPSSPPCVDCGILWPP